MIGIARNLIQSCWKENMKYVTCIFKNLLLPFSYWECLDYDTDFKFPLLKFKSPTSSLRGWEDIHSTTWWSKWLFQCMVVWSGSLDSAHKYDQALTCHQRIWWGIDSQFLHTLYTLAAEKKTVNVPRSHHKNHPWASSMLIQGTGPIIFWGIISGSSIVHKTWLHC
jgi:hypothetical protein